MKTLMKHQRAGLRRIRPRLQCALFWQMRLGKTLVAIRWAGEKPDADRILVVCPYTVIENWEEHLAEEGEEFVTLVGSEEKRLKLIEDNPQARWFLVNYEGLTRRRRPGEDRKAAVPSALALLPWDAVLLDESTRIRNPTADITRVVNRTLCTAKYRGLLTGLPNPEGPEDFFEQMFFLYGQFMGCRNYWQFRERFFANLQFYEWFPKPGALPQIKNEVRKLGDFLSRKQVGMQNRKVYEVRKVELPPRIRKAYVKLERDYELGDQSTKFAPVKRTWLLRLAGGYPDDEQFKSDHKMKELVNILTGELKQEPAVVFFRFNREMEEASAALEKKGVKCLMVYGGIERKERQRRRWLFQNRKSRIMLCQTSCVRYGLDFSRSDTVIYYSNWDEYELRPQSEDRIVHPMKNEPLLVIDLVVRDTVEEDQLYALRKKGANAKFFEANLIESFNRRKQAREGAKAKTKGGPRPLPSLGSRG